MSDWTLSEEQLAANRQINAHLLAAERHIERGNTSKAEEHLLSATQTAEANGIPCFGRYTLPAIITRQAAHEHRENERKLKNREERL